MTEDEWNKAKPGAQLVLTDMFGEGYIDFSTVEETGYGKGIRTSGDLLIVPLSPVAGAALVRQLRRRIAGEQRLCRACRREIDKLIKEGKLL